jgi:hypothetical protein
MDGSRGAKNVPRPQPNAGKLRPGMRKPDPPPVAPASQAASKPAATPPARPAGAASRGGSLKVDEDDPFGMGTAGAVNAIAASLKPEKGRLHKVICPMCEQAGFVPKSAVGKPVRCANEKCLVPVFVAADPDAQTTERRPTRLTDQAEEARRLAEAARPAKRSPMLMYAVIGGITLAVAAGVVTMLNRTPDTSSLNAPITTVNSGDTIDEEELDRIARAKAEADAAAAIAADPRTAINAIVRKMITTARSTNVRDKAVARRMTADVYLRLNDATAAAQELSQLVTVDRSRSFYRVEPLISVYWRTVDSDKEAAQKALADAIAEVPAFARTGRAAAEAALTLAAALVHENRLADAGQLVASRQLDRSTPANRDLMTGFAALYISGRCRDAALPAPAAMDSLRWADPLFTAVAADLAIHQRWAAAMAWSTASRDPRMVADSLVVVSELAATQKAAADVYSKIEAAAQGLDPVSALRVRAAVAAATRDAARLTACNTTLQETPVPNPIPLPTSTELAQQDVPDRTGAVERAAVAAEVARAAAVINQADIAAAALGRMFQELNAAAPPTRAVRTLTNQLAVDESAYRRRIADEMKVSDQTQFEGMFRNYRRHLEQVATAAELRRLQHLVLLARVVRSGGSAAVQQYLAGSTEAAQDVLLDPLCGLTAAAVRMAGGDVPILLQPDASQFLGQPLYDDAQAALALASSLDQTLAFRNERLADGLRALGDTGTASGLPGLRQALVLEVVEFAATESKSPDNVLTAVLALPNEVWREECLFTIALLATRQQREEAVESWQAAQKLKSLEAISMMYGECRALLERPVPAATEDAKEPSASSASGPPADATAG